MSDDAGWSQFERQLNQHTLRVYELHPQRARIDATTAKYYGRMTQEGLFQFGHSKDHRPDLPQLKLNLAVLDPLGLPWTTTVVNGNCADDPLYVPEITRVQQSVGRHGLTYIGDCKMAAQRTRTYIAASGDYYFCPLPSTQVPTEELHRLLQAVWTGKQPLMAVDRPAAPGTPGAEPQRIAEAYQYTVPMEAQVEGCRVT